MDAEGRLGISIVQHLISARHRAGAPPNMLFAMTEETMRQVARKLGHILTLKACRRMRRRLLAGHVIEEVSSYRQGYTPGPVFKGYRVSLFRVTLLANRSLRFQKRPVGTCARVKWPKRHLAWFETVLGSLDGRAPPGLDKDRARKMSTLDAVYAVGSAEP